MLLRYLIHLVIAMLICEMALLCSSEYAQIDRISCEVCSMVPTLCFILSPVLCAMVISSSSWRFYTIDHALIAIPRNPELIR